MCLALCLDLALGVAAVAFVVALEIATLALDRTLPLPEMLVLALLPLQEHLEFPLRLVEGVTRRPWLRPLGGPGRSGMRRLA